MKIPKTPLSKEAYAHFRNKVKRGEKFHGKDKMVKRLEMYDNGYREKHKDGVEYEN